MTIPLDGQLVGETRRDAVLDLTHRGHLVYSGHVSVEVLDPDAAHPYERVAVRSKDVVHVLPLDDQGRTVLVSQHRHPIGAPVLELPAGGIEAGQSPLEAAHRELGEETGQRAGSMVMLGSFLTCPGVMDERAHLFLALDCHPDPDAPPADEHEEIALERVPLSEVLGRLAHSGVSDAKSTLLVLLSQAYLQRQTGFAGS